MSHNLISLTGQDCAARTVGDNNVFEPKSKHLYNSRVGPTIMFYVGYVGSQVVVTDECIIGAACSVDGTESLPHRTIICGARNQRYLLAQPPSVSYVFVCQYSCFLFLYSLEYSSLII